MQITRASKNIFSFWSNYRYNLFFKILQKKKYSDLTYFIVRKKREHKNSFLKFIYTKSNLL